MLLNFNTWYGIFTCWPATSSTNCHFFKKKKTKLLCSVFEWKDFFYVSPSWNLSKRQVVDSWNKKGGRYFFFLKAICIFLPSCDLIIFVHIHLFHSQNFLSSFKDFKNLKPRPLAPLFYFDKTYFYSMF